jgi:hypothetical protein
VSEAATVGRAAGAAIGFVLLYAAAEFLRLPRLVVDPSPFGIHLARTVQGVEMGYYGLLAWGLVGAGAGAPIGRWLGERAPDPGRAQGLAAAWTATAFICVSAFFVWNNWPR